MASLVCDIVTPAQQEFSAECYMVAVPGESGHMGFMPGHAPLMSTLADGEVRIFSDANTLSHRFACQGGYVQVTGEKVIVLTDRAVPADSIDTADVSAKLAEVESKLAALEEGAPERSVLEYDLRWYRTLQQIASA